MHRRIAALLPVIALASVTFLPVQAALGQNTGTKPGDPAPKLKFVLIFARHGVRSPTGTTQQLNQYSAQPWPKWDVPPGDLTPRGARLMSIFGAYYRSYFAQQGLLAADGCSPAEKISIYADSDERTVETGHALSTGMFPGCSASQQPVQHAAAEGAADPLFHALAAGVGKPDRDRAAASIAGRIGGDPAGVTEAYRAELNQLQRILLGCVPGAVCPSPGHTAQKLMLDTPASLDGGKGDHLAEFKGPLSVASTMSENLLLEYTTGMPASQVGWGNVDLATLKQIIDLHTAASDLTRRTPYLATVQASNTLSHILDTLRQSATEKAVPGALGNPGDRVLVMVGHDTNLANMAGMLDLDWLLDGRRDDTPPGGALVFELWQRQDAPGLEVRTYYTAQTLEQMHNASPLTLDAPPAKSEIYVPGCSTARAGYACDWETFASSVEKAIDPAFVR